MVERTLSVYRGGKLHCCLLIFRLLPLQSQPTGEPFCFACKAVSPMGVLVNVPNSSCLEHLRFSYVYGFALFPFSWLSSILGFTEFSWKSGETALWSHRAAREIGRTFMWGFGHHTPWRMAYMRGGLFFQGRLASVFGEDGLPSHLHLFWKPGYPSLQPTWTCHSPHKCAILYAPISIAEVSESYFSVSTFSYFLICLYKYIVL